jgi:hypothetical protein
MNVVGLALLLTAFGFYLAVLWRTLHASEPQALLLPFLVCGAFPVLDSRIEAALALTEAGAAALLGAGSLVLYLIVIGASRRMADRLAICGLALAPGIALLIASMGPNVLAAEGPFATRGDELAFWQNAGTAALFAVLALALLRSSQSQAGSQGSAIRAAPEAMLPRQRDT